MQHRPLGRSGLSIPKLMIGGNVFGWTADQARSHRLLDAMVEAGLVAIDTADVYSAWAPGHHGGESETVIGEWLARSGKRDWVMIATKVGSPMPDGSGLSRAWIMRAVEDSLRRLHTDRIDLYQAHRDDTATPLEETLDAFAELIRQGKVRAIGASNYTADRLREALSVSARHGLPRYESLQPHYNLLERAEFEGQLAELCRAEGLGVIPYFALAAGFLSGKYRSEADLAKSPRGQGVRKYLNDKGRRVLAALDTVAARRAASQAEVALAWLAARPRGQGVRKYLNDKGRRVLAALDTVAARRAASQAEVALAWLMARPGITAPIASATTLEQLEDLAAATRLELTQEDVEALDKASAG